MTDRPRILLFDFEVSPTLAEVYGYYKTDVLWVVRDYFIFCVSWTWLGQKEIYTISQIEFDRYKHSRTDDEPLVRAFLKIINKADIVVAHNGKKFDLYNKVGQARRCKACGSEYLNKHGFDYLATGVYQRYACRKCGNTSNRGERIDFKVPIK